MADFLFANNAESRLATSLSPADTTVAVLPGDGAKFPEPDVNEQFPVTLWDPATGYREICYCTSRTGDTLTVQRGQEGTAPFAFPENSIVSLQLTAGVLEWLKTFVPGGGPTPTFEFFVIPGLLDGDVYGWDDGVAGAVDPDPVFVNGTRILGIFQLTSQFVVRVESGDPLPESITKIRVETADGEVEFDAQDPDHILEGLLRWNADVWSSSDINQVRKVTFE